MLVTLIPAFLPAPSPRDTLRLWNGGPAPGPVFLFCPANFDFFCNFFWFFFCPSNFFWFFFSPKRCRASALPHTGGSGVGRALALPPQGSSWRKSGGRCSCVRRRVGETAARWECRPIGRAGRAGWLGPLGSSTRAGCRLAAQVAGREGPRGCELLHSCTVFEPEPPWQARWRNRQRWMVCRVTSTILITRGFQWHNVLRTR